MCFAGASSLLPPALVRIYDESGMLRVRVGVWDDDGAPPSPRAKVVECVGCGAPVARHLHHCEYCRRPQ